MGLNIRTKKVPTVADIDPALPYGNYGIFLIMGDAGFIPSTVMPEGPRVEC